jgi:hypothetical protein
MVVAFVGFSRIFLLGILIFKGFTARRLYKSFGVKGLNSCATVWRCDECVWFIDTRILFCLWTLSIIWFVMKPHVLDAKYWYISLPAIGLTPGGSSTVHVYTQAVQRTTQVKYGWQYRSKPAFLKLFFKWGPLLLVRIFYGPPYSCPLWEQIVWDSQL